jgi:hypothetical protein
MNKQVRNVLKCPLRKHEVHVHKFASEQELLFDAIRRESALLWEFLRCKAMFDNITYKYKYIKDVQVLIKPCNI